MRHAEPVRILPPDAPLPVRCGARGRAKRLPSALDRVRQVPRGGRVARPGARRGRALSHHMTLCPRSALARRVAAVSSVPKASSDEAVLGHHLVGLTISGRRACQERLPGVLSTRKVLSLCLLAIAYSWSGALIAHSWSGALGPRAAPMAANGSNERLCACLQLLIHTRMQRSERNAARGPPS